MVPYEEYACALVYFTGSAHFNRSLRHLCKKMNMSLNEHALRKGVVRKVSHSFLCNWYKKLHVALKTHRRKGVVQRVSQAFFTGVKTEHVPENTLMKGAVGKVLCIFHLCKK